MMTPGFKHENDSIMLIGPVRDEIGASTYLQVIHGLKIGPVSSLRLDVEKALQDYTEAIRLNPKRFGAYIDRGKLYLELREYEKARADYERAIEIKPNDAGVYISRGNFYHTLREFKKAVRDLIPKLKEKNLVV